MKLWLLERIGQTGWDEYLGFVVRAETEEDARQLASARAGDEGAGTWLAPSASSCNQVADTGERGIVLEAFNAG